MKINGRIFFSCISLLLSSIIFAQQTGQPVLFANGPFITGNNIEIPLARKENLNRASYGQQYFMLLQFGTIPSQQVQDRLKQAGIELHTYLPGKAYLATIQRDFNFLLAPKFNIVSINAVPSFYKIAPGLLTAKNKTDQQTDKLIAVKYYPTIGRAIVQQQLQLAGATIVPTKFDKDQLIFIQAGPAVITSIADLPFVSELRFQSITDKQLNYNNVATHGFSGLNAWNGKNLNGKGVVVGIGDNADISPHVDFTGRVINRNPWFAANHGTHVAGTAGGAGIVNVKNRGMAQRATLINQFFSNIITEAPAYVADNNMVLTNNSYYTVEDGCPGNGEYDVLSNYADQQAAGYPQLLHVIAAGNDGTRTCSPFPFSYGTVKSGWQSAKNTLAVGAINTEDYSIANFSSRGPLKDGRLKPEIVAGGWAINSTLTGNSYGVNWGTSMAAPVVTGALTLMYERYRQLHAGANPKNPLMKAIVCNTAEDLGNAGPDFTFGFGMLNTRRAVEAIDSNRFFINAVSNGGNGIHVLPVPNNTRRLKILLYWSDAAAATNAASALVNDLDLTVTEPAALLHRPLVLNATPANVSNTAVEGIDRLNNIEQVVIENPVAGNYTINVNGFAVPFGAQEYIISYEIIKESVTVEYPAGGEKWVPGETEQIRWSAYGNEANTFTIEYSINNGTSWTTLNNNVPANSRKYTWVVPAALITNEALVRVSRNGTALTDQSDVNFTVLGSPVVTANNVCEGAVQLNWNSISGAGSYDVLKLTGDSMQVIGNTTDLSLLVKGLNKNERAWFGVAAKNGAWGGRRSLSVSMVPNAGGCTLPDFNNDLKVDSILEPASARQGFANAANATKAVKILIRNLGTVAVNGPLDVTYRYGNATVTESISPLITAGGTYEYTFTGAYPVIPSGYRYDFSAWVTLAADGNHLNDTAYKTVKFINNDAITTLPVIEGFETMPVITITQPEMAIGENKRFDFTGSTVRRRARSFVNSGFAYSGNRAITLDQATYNDVTNADSLTLSFNLSNYVSKQLRTDFFYKNHGQAAAPGNKVWMRGSENDAWLEAYDLFANQSALGTWKQAIININEVLGNAVPAQSVSPTFQVKIGQEGNTSANNAIAQLDIDDGYTIDDVQLNEVFNDVAVTKIISPDISGCSLGATHQVSIQIKNYNNIALNNLTVSYQVNGSAIITENIPALAANQTLDYAFVQTANMAAFIDYDINVWVNYPGDTYPVNDSILNYTVRNSPLISTYPYLQNFEDNDGYFYTRGTFSSWEWGTPANSLIDKAASGTKAWVTNLTGSYNDLETSYLYSPCFNVQGLTQPVLSFSHIFKTEEGYDYSWVEYSADGGAWQKLGAVGNGTNWYDESTLVKWSAPNSRWHVASIHLPIPATVIRFRFVLSSDAGVKDEGIGIDDIHVFDKAAIYTGPPVTNITQNLVQNDWVHFYSGGNRVVSLHAAGVNPGATSVQVHPYSGAVRNSNNQYYADRNIVVRSALPPTGKVRVRFYFTDAEARALVNANGCISCNKPMDPYELGITKYSGNAGDENGLLEDNIAGHFQYILPANTTIVPYDNGYYAEFSVDNFSEFWLSAGLVKPPTNGVCPGETIQFSVGEGATTYQWQENSGSGYNNITDGSRYDGTGNSTLQLINLPTSFSGYTYRCLINGVAGNEFAVRFKNVWNGSAGNDWFTGANWSCGVVPDQYTDAVIPGGITNYPVVNAITAVKSITVLPGATVTVSGAANLQITGK